MKLICRGEVFLLSNSTYVMKVNNWIYSSF